MKRFNWYIIGKFLIGIGIALTTVGYILINVYEDYRPREYVQWTLLPGDLDVLGTIKLNRKQAEARSFDGVIYEENIKFYAQVITPENTGCAPEPPSTQPPPSTQKLDWGHVKINATEANQITNASQITVCVLDTGLERTHPDVKAYSGQDFTGGNNWNDIFGHGTHVAGIISAVNNSVGSVGASQSRLIIGKVLGNDGSGSLEGIAKGIVWCTDQGAKVINMSLGGGGPTQLMYQALLYATQRGVKVIAAAGNDAGPTNYPAAFQMPNLYAVSATDQNDKITSFSSRGKIEISAPGLNIFSTIPMNGCGICGQSKGWGKMSGTSMATPYASAVMALALSVNKEIKADQIGVTSNYGIGRVNALKSVE